MRDRLVVDTTIFATIVLREGDWRELAGRLASLRAIFAAPFFRFECANVVWKRRRELGAEASAAALDLVWGLGVDERFDVADAHRALILGRNHQLPFYDAAFIAVAEREGVPLWTLDGRQGDVASALGVVLQPR